MFEWCFCDQLWPNSRPSKWPAFVPFSDVSPFKWMGNNLKSIRFGEFCKNHELPPKSPAHRTQSSRLKRYMEVLSQSYDAFRCKRLGRIRKIRRRILNLHRHTQLSMCLAYFYLIFCDCCRSKTSTAVFKSSMTLCLLSTWLTPSTWPRSYDPTTRRSTMKTNYR